jgi:hypothetical protein
LVALVGIAAVGLSAPTASGACGAWQKVTGGRVHGQLFDVAATSATDAWAVGESRHRTLAEHWDGSTWRRIATPNPDQRSDSLVAVAAIAPDNAWAVGGFGLNVGEPLPAGGGPLLVHWDGRGWRRQILPNGARRARLFDVAAVSSSDVWLVGRSRNYVPRILHYNGSTWTVIPAVNPGLVPELLGVAATSSSDAWAVGHYGVSDKGTLVEHWNGHAWRLVPHRSDGGLYAVAAVSATDVWALGFTAQSDGRIDHWDGASWTAVAQAAHGIQLSAVAASGPNDAWAVGSHFFRGDPATDHWNGTTGTAPHGNRH